MPIPPRGFRFRRIIDTWLTSFPDYSGAFTSPSSPSLSPSPSTNSPSLPTMALPTLLNPLSLDWSATTATGMKNGRRGMLYTPACVSRRHATGIYSKALPRPSTSILDSQSEYPALCYQFCVVGQGSCTLLFLAWTVYSFYQLNTGNELVAKSSANIFNPKFRIFNTGSPYNVPAGHSANLDELIAHYERQNVLVNEAREARRRAAESDHKES